jgi:xanthine/CO dehydrogenase XdhC/CoxF family maturation factor
MRELRDILGAFQMLRQSGGEGVLASAVHTEGSTYRRPGARMLVLPDDRVIGLISGGCLEGDLLEQARSVRESGKPRIVRYDMRPEEDIVWGLGLGCAGVVEVLLERVDAEAAGPLDLLAECVRERRPGVLATSLAGNVPLATRWVLHPDGRFSGPTAGGGEIERAARRAADQDLGALMEGEAGRILIEVVRPAPRLLVFGRGPGSAHRLRARLGSRRGGLAPRLCPPGELPGSERRRAV